MLCRPGANWSIPSQCKFKAGSRGCGYGMLTGTSIRWADGNAKRGRPVRDPLKLAASRILNYRIFNCSSHLSFSPPSVRFSCSPRKSSSRSAHSCRVESLSNLNQSFRPSHELAASSWPCRQTILLWFSLVIVNVAGLKAEQPFDTREEALLRRRAEAEWSKLDQTAISKTQDHDDIPAWALHYVRGTRRPRVLNPPNVAVFGAPVQNAAAELLSLDGSDRKKNLPRIVAVADSLDPLLRQSTGVPADVVRAARVETLYRKARALAYRDLPGVQNDDDYDSEANAQSFDRTIEVMQTLADLTQPEYLALWMRYHRRHGRSNVALDGLLKAARRDPGRRIGESYLFDKKRRDLYDELGWPQLRLRANEHIENTYGNADQIEATLRRAREALQAKQD